MISFPLFTSSANSFWTSKFQWISDYKTLHPFPIPPPARCFQFTWQLLICSPNPFLLGLTRFKVTPSPLETLKILCTQRWLSPLSTKKDLSPISSLCRDRFCPQAWGQDVLCAIGQKRISRLFDYANDNKDKLWNFKLLLHKSHHDGKGMALCL